MLCNYEFILNAFIFVYVKFAHCVDVKKQLKGPPLQYILFIIKVNVNGLWKQSELEGKVHCTRECIFGSS